jgi:hypothetical protein
MRRLGGGPFRPRTKGRLSGLLLGAFPVGRWGSLFTTNRKGLGNPLVSYPQIGLAGVLSDFQVGFLAVSAKTS